ncbi:MAG: hypothetical protein M3Q31_05245 [Actinomycetota bacterium]|nr:hypothetical protein [Actinomycetota bacterium]
MKRFALLGLAVLAVVGALAGTALAAQPTTEVFTIVNSSGVNTALCGFAITFTENGTFKVTTYYDSAGNPVKSILTNYKSRYTETATANGKTLLANYPLVSITSFPSGAGVNVGLYVNYTVPGAGAVLLDAGRIVFNPDGTVVFEAGLHQRIDGDVGAFCAYFA